MDPGAIGRACEREDETTFRFRLADEEDLPDLLPALVRAGPVRDITVLGAGMKEIVRKMYETGGATA